MGKARAKLSDQYISEHKAKIEKLDTGADDRDGQDRGMVEKMCWPDFAWSG